MAFLKTVVTPAGVHAVHEAGLAGLQDSHRDGMGQWEDIVNALPDLIKSGGDVATQMYRAANYEPTRTSVPAYTSGATGAFGMTGGTMLLLGAGILAFMLLRK